MFYTVYGSEFNRESLHTLQHSFSLGEFLRHQEYITFKEDLEIESRPKAK